MTPWLRGIQTMGCLLVCASVLLGFAGLAGLVIGLVSSSPKITIAVSSEDLRFSSLNAVYVAAVAGIVAYGLFRGRRWGWDGAFCVAAWCAPGGLMALLVGINNGGLEGGVFAALGAASAVWAVTALWYLLRRKVQAPFTVDPDANRPQLPLGVRLIAAYSLILSGARLLELASPTPPLFFGLAVQGFVMPLYAISMAALSLYIGYGLYRMRERARQCAIAVAALWGLESVSWVVLPQRSWSTPPFRWIAVGAAVIGVGVAMVMTWYLVTRRKGFT